MLNVNAVDEPEPEVAMQKPCPHISMIDLEDFLYNFRSPFATGYARVKATCQLLMCEHCNTDLLNELEDLSIDPKVM